jgi:hypothetical protein
MCLFSPSSCSTQQETTATTTTQNTTNTNTSGNEGVTTSGSNDSVNVTSSCAGVVKAAIACETALAGGSIRTIACLSKSLSLDLTDSENDENARLTCFASCIVRSDQKFASASVCAVSRLACQDVTAIACLAAKNQASNNTLLSAVAGTLSGIATAQDTSQAAQSTAFAQNVLKYAAIAVLGLGALAVIYSMSKK